MSSSYVSVQSQKTRGVKSLTAILLSLVLVVAFLPSFFFASLGTAFADTQEITGGATISTGGTYKIASDAMAAHKAASQSKQQKQSQLLATALAQATTLVLQANLAALYGLIAQRLHLLTLHLKMCF